VFLLRASAVAVVDLSDGHVAGCGGQGTKDSKSCASDKSSQRKWEEYQRNGRIRKVLKDTREELQAETFGNSRRHRRSYSSPTVPGQGVIEMQDIYGV
jgi:hypothetical protein